MNATTEKPYRDLEDVPLEDLEQLFQLLRDVKVSPTDLLAYAVALDTLEAHKENSEEDEESVMTLEDTLEVNHECDRDDADTADALYSSARLILIKMNKLEAH